MLISHYRHLEDVEGVPFSRELILRGAEERLAPILMTALVTALALLPVVLAGHKAGHEIEHPMAVVILGGLITSTLLNLLLLPALYERFGIRQSPQGVPWTKGGSGTNATNEPRAIRFLGATAPFVLGGLPVQREPVARFEEMNSRTAARNSGRREAPRSPP